MKQNRATSPGKLMKHLTNQKCRRVLHSTALLEALAVFLREQLHCSFLFVIIVSSKYWNTEEKCNRCAFSNAFWLYSTSPPVSKDDKNFGGDFLWETQRQTRSTPIQRHFTVSLRIIKKSKIPFPTRFQLPHLQPPYNCQCPENSTAKSITAQLTWRRFSVSLNKPSRNGKTNCIWARRFSRRTKGLTTAGIFNKKYII